MARRLATSDDHRRAASIRHAKLLESLRRMTSEELRAIKPDDRRWMYADIELRQREMFGQSSRLSQ